MYLTIKRVKCGRRENCVLKQEGNRSTIIRKTQKTNRDK
jgi:hypothetical protein